MSPLKEVIINKQTSINPIWIMRQAGRYLPEFREIRRQNPDFIKLCLNENLSSEITLQPLKRFEFDAAIICSPTSLHINYTHARLNYYVSVCVRVLVCYVCAMCAYVMCVWHVLMYEICACVYVSVFFVLMCVCVCVCILARRLACNNWGDGCDVHVV